MLDAKYILHNLCKVEQTFKTSHCPCAVLSWHGKHLLSTQNVPLLLQVP